MQRLDTDIPRAFNFRTTAISHGWYDLAPFEFDETNWRLGYVFGSGSRPAYAEICEDSGRLRVNIYDDAADAEAIMRAARHLLRLDDDLTEFYAAADSDERLAWVRARGAGRLLRSATVFEDLVKTICTTNCSWALTKSMVRNLVEKLGEPTADGRRAFPTAEAMAAMPAAFYRDEVRAGYRAGYLVELAEAVAAGRLTPETWLTTDMPTVELKKAMKQIKGVGDYAAENLLKLVGRYEGLALDSWLRGRFYKVHNREKPCPDRKIERHYKHFGMWRGLAIWCDMTEDWH